MEKAGFFVKVKEKEYQGPFVRLKEAREDARRVGSNLEIYHGVLKDSDDSNLHLVPKLKKS